MPINKGSYIQFDGWSHEEHEDRDAAFNMALKLYLPIAKKINNTVGLHIHVKRHNTNKEGKIKYTVNSRIRTPGLSFMAKETEWSFLKAVSSSLKTLQREVREKLKNKSNSHKNHNQLTLT